MTILRDLRTDIHYGVRSLRLAPGFALAALATLVLTIGGSTAAFSIVNGVILAPLPFEESDRLVSLHTLRSDGSLSNSFSSLGRVSDLRQRSGALEELAASRVARASLDEPVEQIEYSLVTAGYFDLLRVRPALGRIFEAGLLSDGTTPALISHPYWQARWGGIPEVLGQTIRLEDQPVLTIVGVLPETFRRPFTAALPAPVWVPLEAVVVPQGIGFGHSVLGRLASGETLESAQAELEVLYASLAGGVTPLVLRPLSETVIGPDARRTVLIFAAAVAMVLLIGVLNLIDLLASRISKRQTEFSIRVALGASRSRLIRQMIAEALSLTTSGALVGLLIVYLVRDLALAAMPPVLPRLSDISIDARVFAFAVASALASGLLIGIVPALRASRPDVNASLKEGAPRTTATRGQRWFQGFLTVAQTSMAVVLLIGAGLLVHSFWRLISLDPGFDRENLRIVRISLPSFYAEAATRNAFVRRLLGEVVPLPGVEGAATVDQLPIGGQGLAFTTLRTGDAEPLTVIPTAVSPEFGRVMRLPVVSGRWFTSDEAAGESPVIVVSESTARQMWPGEDASGKEFLGMRVLGVVGDVRVRMRTEPMARIYSPYSRPGALSLPGQPVALTLAVRVPDRTRLDLGGVVTRIEPDSAVAVSSMKDLIRADVERERFQSAVLTAFAAAALILATLGVYSVVAFSTAQRTREIGLRMALGAQARDVVAQMMWKGAVPAVTGLAIGLAASAALARFLESYLFEIDPVEPGTFAAVAVSGLALVLLASWLPARRAARVDPMTTLRHE